MALCGSCYLGECNTHVWHGSITLACGHGWEGDCQSEAKAQEFLDLCLTTGDSTHCRTCDSQQAITGPLVAS